MRHCACQTPPTRTARPCRGRQQARGGTGPRLQRRTQLPPQGLQARAEAERGRKQLDGRVGEAVVLMAGVVEPRRRRGRAARRCLLPRLAPRPGALARGSRASCAAGRAQAQQQQPGPGRGASRGSTQRRAARPRRRPGSATPGMQPLLRQRQRTAAGGRALLCKRSGGAERGAGSGAAGADRALRLPGQR